METIQAGVGPQKRKWKHLVGPIWETISKEELNTSSCSSFLSHCSPVFVQFCAFPLLLTLGCITGEAREGGTKTELDIFPRLFGFGIYEIYEICLVVQQQLVDQWWYEVE